MKKLLVCICSLMMVFMFVSCQTAEKAPPEESKPKAPPEANKPEKPSVPVSINLNGKWKFTSKWSMKEDMDIDEGQFEIVQKGTKITWINIPPGEKNFGTLEGNILHMEPIEYGRYDNPQHFQLTIHQGGRESISLPARKLKISQDGNTMSCNYNFFALWAGGSAFGRATITCIRE